MKFWWFDNDKHNYEHDGNRHGTKQPSWVIVPNQMYLNL